MGMEDTGVHDSFLSLPVRISTTTRVKYKEMFPEDHEYQSLPNIKLNKLIADQFALSGQHQKEGMPFYFHNKEQADYKSSRPYREREKPLTELRMAVWSWSEGMISGSTTFFVSFIRGGNIDVLTIQQGYLPRKKKGPKRMKYKKDWEEKRRLGRY